MSASMAEVVAQHRIVWESDGDYGEKQWVACSCTHLSFEDDYWTGETQSDHETHVAEQLAANGYGKLEDAQARAYDKGYGHGKYDQTYHPAMSLSGTPRPEKSRRNPYRRPE